MHGSQLVDVTVIRNKTVRIDSAHKLRCSSWRPAWTEIEGFGGSLARIPLRVSRPTIAHTVNLDKPMECYTFMRQGKTSHCEYFLAASCQLPEEAHKEGGASNTDDILRMLGIVIRQIGFGVYAHGASNCRYKTNWGNSAVPVLFNIQLFEIESWKSKSKSKSR